MSRTNGYPKIAEHFRQQIRDGILKPGDTLPSFKDVAAQFGVAITTVNRAFRLLKSEGLTVSTPGAKTVVATPAIPEQQAEEPHTELGDCIKLVASSVWDAAWRQARGDQEPEPTLSAQVDHLIEHTDFLRMALYRHNWRNVSTVLAAFRDAGLAGSSDVAAFYSHVNHIPNRREGDRA